MTITTKQLRKAALMQPIMEQGVTMEGGPTGVEATRFWQLMNLIRGDREVVTNQILLSAWGRGEGNGAWVAEQEARLAPSSGEDPEAQKQNTPVTTALWKYLNDIGLI